MGLGKRARRKADLETWIYRDSNVIVSVVTPRTMTLSVKQIDCIVQMRRSHFVVHAQWKKEKCIVSILSFGTGHARLSERGDCLIASCMGAKKHSGVRRWLQLIRMTQGARCRIPANVNRQGERMAIARMCGNHSH